MSCQPEHDRGEDDSTSVDQGVFVIAGREASPVPEVVEGAFDDVAVLVVVGVEVDRSPAA
jgi:hypothetical protein